MKTAVIIFLLFFGVQLIAQNLISNGSFEEFETCPDDYSKLYYVPYVKYWDSPNAGTPDYFNPCSQKCGVPLNWVGNAEAYDGNAYMGIIACMHQFDRNQIAYREYIRIKLNDTLLHGQRYYASMKVRLGLSCTIACNGLGMFFSKQPYTTSRKINYPFTSQIIYANNNIVDDKDSWTQLCGTFIADGGETFLMIGNFLSNQQMQFKLFDKNLLQTQYSTPSAYYLIDNVEVLKYTDSLLVNCDVLDSIVPNAFEGKIEKDQNLILKNLHFETDKAAILKQSYYELDELVNELKKNPALKITIHGHTDNSGTEQYNLELSKNRALAVRNYLLQKGISKFRLKTEGFGSSKPIADNATEEGKKLNRRVEIVVY